MKNKLVKDSQPQAVMQQEEWYPGPPSIGNDMALFLSFVKKRGLAWDLRHCKIKWRQMGHDSDQLEKELSRLGTAFVMVALSPHGTMMVRVMNRAWADNWAIYHGVELPHHGQPEHPGKKVREHLTKK